MGILTAFLALLSCALVGAGIWLVLRDTRRVQARRAAAAPREVKGIGLLPDLSPPVQDAPPPPATPATTADALGADLAAALRAVNGAFAPAGISLVHEPDPAVPADAEADGAGRPEAAFAVALMAGAHRAGRLQVVRAGDMVEISASTGSTHAERVERRRRLSRDEASIPSLAESIAACAWPVATAVLSPRLGKS